MDRPEQITWTRVTVVFGDVYGRCDRVMSRGFEICVLDGVNT